MNKILIVEDEPVLRKAYTTLFKLEKFRVYQAANGFEALQQVPKVKPEIIILDVLMPGMGGIEFLQEVGLAKNYPLTKVLMLSNLSDPKTLQQLNELRIDRYILKSSVTPSQLVSAVREILAA